MSTALELGDLQRWAAVVALVATLLLEVVDAVREWPTQRPPITAGECLDLCAGEVQRWTYDECGCRGDEPPVDTGGSHG